MRKKLLGIVCIMVIGISTSCVNYEKIIEEKEGDKGIVEANEEEIGVLVADLGDINDNGHTEKVIVEKNILKLTDGAKICYRTDVASDYIYTNIRAIMTDLDGDKQMEIAVLLESEIECFGSYNPEKLYDVFVLNSNESGEYSLAQFPNEVDSKASYSGLCVDVTASGRFEYKVKCMEFETTINLSRHYKESLLLGESHKNLLEKWDKIINSDYHGESLGVSYVMAVRDKEGNTILRVQQYVVGGDGAIIGYIETDLQYDALGGYEVKDIRFIERVSLM